MSTVEEQTQPQPQPQAMPLCYIIAGVSGSGKSCALAYAAVMRIICMLATARTSNQFAKFPKPQSPRAVQCSQTACM